MKQYYKKYFLLLVALAIGILEVSGQTVITGKVYELKTNQPLIGVNILVEGYTFGTVTDFNGNFKISVSNPLPLTLAISYIGYGKQEIKVGEANINTISIGMEEETILGQEVVVSASKIEENILQSPVAIEKIDALEIQSTPSDNYYKSLANIKGVDITTNSINFQVVNTRGFGSTGNERFVQLVDGMDTQAPGLNFPVGNLNGPSELDIESLELISGASSALYGPNAVNGILLMNSKNAFEYQGLSAYAKGGVNHIGGPRNQPAPLYDASLRYAKAFHNKFAFKVNASYSQAIDWYGNSDVDRNAENNPFKNCAECVDRTNPGEDKPNYMGDEAGLNLNLLRFSTVSTGPVNWQTLASIGEAIFEPGITAWNYASKGFLPNHVVTAPSYHEKYIVNYNARNIKASGGLYYRINNKIELSYLYNGGAGTSVYTGAQRYSLVNFAVHQHRLQIKGDNFYVRAYSTTENSGDAYIAEFAAKQINDARAGGNVTSYLTKYPIYYLESLYKQGIYPDTDPTNVTLSKQSIAHAYARGMINKEFPLEAGSDAFNTIKSNIINGVQTSGAKKNIVPFGPYFNDNTSLYHLEGQYNFKNQIKWLELLVGGNVRLFNLNSNNSIFADSAGVLIKEFGAYVQGGKNIVKNLKVTASLRYDQNLNFNGQLNPKIAFVYTLKNNHNFRVSYQTGFRNPTTQDQYVDLSIISARLLGGLPQFYEKYNILKKSSTGVPLGYTQESISKFREVIFRKNSSPFDPEAVKELIPLTSYNTVQPEGIQSFEFGYKSIIMRDLLIDFSYYYNIFNNFITSNNVQIAGELSAKDVDDAAKVGLVGLKAGNVNYATLLNGTADNTFQITTNLKQALEAHGTSLGFNYSFGRSGYSVYGNWSWNRLLGVDPKSKDNIIAFNTPENKFNIGVGNRKITENLGFGVTYRWQESFYWSSSFGRGTIPAFGTLDVQASYKLKFLKSIIKIGASNALNSYYVQSFGGPTIGGVYYASITFDQSIN